MTASPELMRIFDFTAADLEANRAKRLSERQSKFIKDESDADRIAVHLAMYVGIIVGGFLLFGVVVFPQGMRAKEISLNGLSEFIVIIVVIVSSFFRYRSNQRANQFTLERPYVGIVEGTAIWLRRQYYRDYRYEITVDGKTFRIERTRFNAFDNFMQFKSKSTLFRIYFAPEINRILSMEIISQ